MSVNLKETVATQNAAGSPILGYLFFYYLPQCLVHRENLRKTLKSVGLGEKYMPPEIRPVDAFRRATRHVEKKNFPAQEEGVFFNYLVRDAGHDRHTVVRRIVREKVDSRGKRLEYNPEEAVLTLDRDSGEMIFQTKPGSVAESMCREAQERYEAYCNEHDDRAIRNMIYNLMVGMNPLTVKHSGSVYFIPQTHQETLQKLVNFINFIKPPESEGTTFELIDKTEVRDIVREKLRQQIKAAMNNLAEVLKSEERDKSVVNLALEDAKQARNDFKAYQELLNEQLTDIGEMVRLIGKQMLTLVNDKQKES